MDSNEKELKYSKNPDYEEKFLFRLIRVCYAIALILAFILVFMGGWDARPQVSVDNEKSNILCSDGRKYNFADSGIFLFSKDSKLNSYQEEKAGTLCSNSGWSTFSLDIVESTRGNWFSSALWWSFGLVGFYILLNLIRETLNYLLLGKPFDWRWRKISPTLRFKIRGNKI